MQWEIAEPPERHGTTLTVVIRLTDTVDAAFNEQFPLNFHSDTLQGTNVQVRTAIEAAVAAEAAKYNRVKAVAAFMENRVGLKNPVT